MLEELRTILEAESEARRQFDAAHRDAARLGQDADEAARTLIRAAHAARAGDAHAVEEALVVAAQRDAQRMQHAARAEAATMASRAAPRMAAAVARLVRALLPAGVADAAGSPAAGTGPSPTGGPGDTDDVR